MKHLSSALFVVVFLAAGCQRKEKSIDPAFRIDLAPASCDIPTIASSSFHEKHLRFAKLLALSLGSSEELRAAVKQASVTSGQDYFNEILVKDFLPSSLPATGSQAAQTVENVIKQDFDNTPSLSNGTTFQSFKDDLLTADPTLVIKIPDWFWEYEWNTASTAPYVISNIKGTGQYLYGFDENGDCLSKESYTEAVNLEVVVKTSEDYLWIDGPEFLQGFAHPCMSLDTFFNTYARSFAGHYLLKKRDMQKLFLATGTGPVGPPNPPLLACKRETGAEHNYLLGFQLANTGIITTLQNQPCLGGEETFDFQIDFLYSYRTAEAAAVDAQLPPLTLYGLRMKDLVDIKINKPWWHSPLFTITPKYFAISIAGTKYDYMKQINPIAQEWDRPTIGEALFVTWNETDFKICTSSGVQTVTKSIGATLNLKLPFKWVPGGTFTGNYSKSPPTL